MYLDFLAKTELPFLNAMEVALPPANNDRSDYRVLLPIQPFGTTQRKAPKTERKSKPPPRNDPNRGKETCANVGVQNWRYDGPRTGPRTRVWRKRHKAPISDFGKDLVKYARAEMTDRKNGQKPLGIKHKGNTVQDSNILAALRNQIHVLNGTVFRPIRGGIGVRSPGILGPSF